ncbi:hypothetical protein N0V88_003802 [Collariella sp. IMI 366227]|nr:hypothetical protein N0V88_003802 [Collariella sp. IMI 366227]
MKSILFLTAAGLALAQNFSGQPECATSCLSSAISAVGCKGEDIGCQCGAVTKAEIAASVAPCLMKACTDGSALLQAQSAGEAQCSSYLATAASNSASTTGSDTATSSGSETATSTTATITNTFTTTQTSTGTDAEGSATTGVETETITETSTSTGGAMGMMATPAIALLGVLGAVAM